MESKAVVGMSMMELPPPSVAEYALTKGMHDAGPNAPQPELVIPICRGQDHRGSPDERCAGRRRLCLAWRRRGDRRAGHPAVVAVRQNERLRHLP